MSSIVVHGGAARIEPADLAGHESVCRRAAERGLAVLRAGGTALDAVVESVVILEDDPVTNAGTGAVLNRDGVAELDALAMEGTGLGLGAVIGVRDVKNPIRLARALLDEPDLNVLMGEGASRYAQAHGVARIDPASLVTAQARRRWLHKHDPAAAHDTVGAVACDASGRVAAAVSTGGIFNKPPGRVGDAPLVGCGGYADDAVGAAVATGVGEGIMRVLLARTALDFLREGRSPMEAARSAITVLGERVAGEGGVIVIDPRGNTGLAFNTPHMSWSSGRVEGSEVESGH